MLPHPARTRSETLVLAFALLGVRWKTGISIKLVFSPKKLRGLVVFSGKNGASGKRLKPSTASVDQDWGSPHLAALKENIDLIISDDS